MKFYLIVFILLSMPAIGFSQGIIFEKISYEEALVKAAKEKRQIFIDCYTSWCGPCKKLAKEVFTKKDVGDFFNKHFVCIKIDMEKGEGIEIGSFYNVKSYPTLLFLDTEGGPLNRSGSSGAMKLIKNAKAAINAAEK